MRLGLWVAEENTGTLDCYVPRVVLRRLVGCPDDPVLTLDGSVVFVDISGFTKLSERLARIGKEGAEQMVDAINGCFAALLADAYANGGGLLKFGGDALLLWFEGPGHALRACASAVAMRRTLRRVGKIETGSSKVVLRMSIGIHSGAFEHFLVGASHREHVVAGPSASTVVAMESLASAGEILISRSTADALPRACLGAPKAEGILLARSPAVSPAPAEGPIGVPDEVIAGCLSTALRAQVLGTEEIPVPEHRTATVAFVQFGELDELIADGAAEAASALDELVTVAQKAADRHCVAFLGSDIAAGGGKLMLTTGAPRTIGDDEERMLLAMREVIDANTRLPVRIGANRGQVFAGEIGPHYRRTYTAMGDTTNLAARVMAKAPWRSFYATPSVLDRSKTKFRMREIEPFMVKGKSRPVHAWEIGPVERATLPASARRRGPLVGRDGEMASLTAAITEASLGLGGLIELVGETGSGKSPCWPKPVIWPRRCGSCTPPVRPTRRTSRTSVGASRCGSSWS